MSRLLNNLPISLRMPVWSFLAFSCALALAVGQQPPEPTQETINKRITEMVQGALQKGTGVTPEGVHYMHMRVSVSREEYKEIKTFGERAISPLSSYLDSDNYRGQLLAVNLVGAIGGHAAIKPLAHAVEKCTYGLARAAALTNLDQQNWDDISEIVKRASVNDPEPFVRKTATDLIAKHEPGQGTR